jgi:DNA-directed RNA polymerase
MRTFKIYGANCFGEDKKSINQRLLWVEKNIDNILNFENGILVKQANKKLLFLAFCMEYRKYINSLNKGDKIFKTYLPIQLDATCNGFQHLSMLSNETKLFKELNLMKSSTSDNPGDFYNYILHLLITNINHTIECESTDMDEEKLDSYKRLSKFILTRSIIKKALMVIPYNAGRRTIRMYIKEALIFDHFEEIPNKDLDVNMLEKANVNTSEKDKKQKKTSTKNSKDTKYLS